MIWHLYDYYLRPGGGYFGTKKACEPVHVQYSYDDRTVIAVNGTNRAMPATRVSARLFTSDLTEQFSREIVLDLTADSSVVAFALPDLAGIDATYYLDLRLSQGSGQLVSSNFYWLSSKMDQLDWEKSTYYVTPVRSYADFSILNRLSKAEIRTSVRYERAATEETAFVTVTNAGNSLGFFIRLQFMRADGVEEILPVLWQDNYFTLLPKETREVRAVYQIKDRGSRQPRLIATPWGK